MEDAIRKMSSEAQDVYVLARNSAIARGHEEGEASDLAEQAAALVGHELTPDNVAPLLAIDVTKYDPNQPREPKGSPEGGRWRSEEEGPGPWAAPGDPWRGLHGTGKELEATILRDGLLRRPPSRNYESDYYVGAGRDVSVYMTDVDYVARHYAYNRNDRDPIIFEIEVPPNFVNKIQRDEIDTRAVRFEGDIPPEWIKAVRRYNEMDEVWETTTLRKAEGRTIYVVVFTEPVEKAGYDPSQPRAPAGSPEGGRWVRAHHGTSRDRLGTPLQPGIWAQGLRAALGEDKDDSDHPYNRSVYLSTTEFGARAYAVNTAEERGAQPMIVTVEVPEGSLIPDEEHAGDSMGDSYVRFEGNIPFERIVRIQVSDDEGESWRDWYVRKYDPNQPREPKGSPEGGRWTSAGGVIDDHPITRSDKGVWGSSHSASSAISGRAATLMGIDGYRDAQYTDESRVTKYAEDFLTAIHDSPGSNEPLYHGFVNRDNIDWQAGDVFKLPLIATTGDWDHAAGYGILGVDYKDSQPPPTVFEFPKGTRIAGYSRWRKADALSFGHQWAEALTAGEFKVVSTRKDIASPWWRPEVTIVRLEPTAWWNPSSKKWEEQS